MRKSPKKWDLERVKLFVEKNSNCTLLSEEFINLNEKMLFLCECGRKFETRFNSFIHQDKIKCDVCSGIKFDYMYIQEFVKNNSDCELLSKEYKNITTKMLFQCKCGNKFQTTFSKFKDRNKRQCNDCGKRKSALKQSKTQDEFIQEVYELVGNEYSVLSEYKNYMTKVKIIHNKCNYTWGVTPSSFLSSSGGCPNCMNKKDPDEFIQEVYELVEGEYVFLEKYNGSMRKILCQHTTCGHEWRIRPHNFLNGNRCPKCNQRIQRTTEIFKKELFDLVGDEYILLGESINSYTKVDILHTKCGNVWNVAPRNIIRGSRCPHCVKYKGEDAIEDFLFKNKINFIKQYSFEDCRNSLPLSFDFAIINNDDNLLSLVEYDGKQHFEPVNFGGISDEEALEKFKTQQLNDNIKNTYCQQNNIKLIRIPYWDFSNLEDILSRELVDLIDNKDGE